MIHISKELSMEYLTAFHKAVKSHPHIYDMLKEEIHKRARGSAGGQVRARKASEAQEEDFELEDIVSHLADESPVKATNAAYMEGEIVETDDYFDVPTVFTREGVWTGTNGIPTLKTFEALKESAPWFIGAPITPKHIDTDTIRPSDRRLGHVVSAIAREDKRDVFGISRYYKSLLNEDETTKLHNRQKIDGSPGYFVPIANESGEFGGKPYQAKEIGPYVVLEYASFFDGTRGACSSDDNCGPFQNAKKKDDFPKSDDKLILDDGKVKKCPKKQKNGEDSMSEELLKPILDRLDAIDKRIEKFENAKPPEVDFSPINSEIESLKEKFANAAKEQDAARDAANKATFGKMLNAAAATEIDTLWQDVKGLSPIEYESWKQTNAAKLLTEMEKKQATGKKQTNGGDLVEQARAKADATLFKRR